MHDIIFNRVADNLAGQEKSLYKLSINLNIGIGFSGSDEKSFSPVSRTVGSNYIGNIVFYDNVFFTRSYNWY